MSLDFNKYAAKGNEVVNMLSEDLKVPRDMAGRILRAVLHAVRNHLGIDESLQVISQLPMALKAVYVDGWNPSRSFHRIHHLAEFLDEIRNEDSKQAGYDFGNNQRAQEAVRAVFRTLNYFLSEGELADLAAVMPAEIGDFIKESTGEGKKVL
jgi:uncharacterized protein (DUF2267 family)